MKSNVGFFIFFGAIALTPIAQADSLFPGSSTADPTITAPYGDLKARRIGDTLTVIISETASTTSTANTSNSKNESLNYGPGFGPLLKKIVNFGITGGISSTAKGSTDRNDNLSASISVTVTKVLPNGNFEVTGHRSVGMNAETQEITLTGVVRPQDITPANTVASPLISDAKIKYDGKGPVGDKQHDGIISHIFKFLF